MNLIQALAQTEDQAPSTLLWSVHLVKEMRGVLQEMGLVAPWCRASDGGMSMYLQTMSPNSDGQWSSESPPRVTPGLIMSYLSKERLEDLSSHLNMPLPAIVEPQKTHSTGAMSMRLLSALTDEELRLVARALDVSDEGRFIDLYRRLSLLC